MTDAIPLPEPFQQFIDHWHALRKGEALPTLSDFLDWPAPKLQPWVGIFDIESEMSWPVRLVGTAVVAYFQADFTGLDFADHIPEEMRAAFRYVLLEAGRAGCGFYNIKRGTTASGRHFHYRVLYLPLARKAQKPSVVWMVSPDERLDAGEVVLPVPEILDHARIDLGLQHH